MGRVGWRPETPPIASAARLKGPGVSAGTGIARASETPAAVSRTRPLIARIYRPRRQAGRAQQIRFEHRTKTEHRATILLPNPVAAVDTKRHATDRALKIRRQINTRWGAGSRAVIAVTAFRVRCIQPTNHLSGAQNKCTAIGAHLNSAIPLLICFVCHRVKALPRYPHYSQSQPTQRTSLGLAPWSFSASCRAHYDLRQWALYRRLVCR